MNITLWITVIYMIVSISLCWFLGRSKHCVREFFVAGGRLPWVLLVPFLMAEYIAASATVGTSEMAHELGVSAIIYQLGAPIGLSILAFGLLKFYVTINKITIGEAFGALFDQKNRLICILLIFTTTAVSCGATFLVLGTILAPLLNVSYAYGVWLSAVFIVLLAVTGLRGIAFMNILHLVTLLVGFGIATFASLEAVGGMSNLLASLPAEHLNIGRLGWSTSTAWIISASFVKLVSVISVTAMFAAKDEKAAKIAAVSSGSLVLLFSLMPLIIGLSAYVLMPDIPSRHALWMMGEEMGTVVSTFLSIGVVAAIVSTAPGLLLGAGGIATRDIFLLILPEAGEKAQLIFSRIIIPFIAAVSAVFALTQPTILGLITKAAQIRAVLAIILLVSVLWRRVHPDVAFAASIIGGGSALIWIFAGSPFGIEPLWPAAFLVFLTLIFGSFGRKAMVKRHA